MLLLGYDIGSSSVKAAIIEADTGKCLSSAYYPKTEAPIKALRQGWAEQAPDQWWDYLRHATSELLAGSRIDPADIAAVGISYQMHGLVAIDRDGTPLRDAIIWCDSRGVNYGEKAFQTLGTERCLKSLLNSPGNFTASKLAWVKENEPELFDRIYKILLPGDYIAYRMTGEISTTVEGLSEEILWDFRRHDIAGFVMEHFGFSSDIIPPVAPTFSVQGRLTPAVAAELGLKAGTPVTYRAGDQPNNALSLNVFSPGEIASTAGTSGVVYGVNDSLEFDPLSRINNFAHVNHSSSQTRIGSLLCINGTGILNSWAKRNIAPDGASYTEINDIASAAPVGSKGLSVLPFGNGAERVLRNQQPECSFLGIDFNTHTRADLLRAVQEGIVFAFKYGIDIMEAVGIPVRHIHAGHANMFLSDIFTTTLASVTGAIITLYDTDGAVGAARGAGIGLGLYKTESEAFENLKALRIITPAADPAPYLEAYNLWKSRLEKILNQ